MNFAPGHHPPDGFGGFAGFGAGRWPAARTLGRALVACCAVTVVTAAFPWTQIQVTSLWGELQGPIGARTNTGFTCLMTSLLTALLVLSEGRSAPAREAVRSACIVLMGVAALALLWRAWQGPGLLRGGSATHSSWFFAAAVAVGLAVLCSRLRLRRPRAERANA